jgi:hypothetical protein
MQKTKIIIKGITLERLSKILAKFAQKHAIQYELKVSNNDVLLDVSMASNKAMTELQRRLRIAGSKFGDQVSMQALEIVGETQ